MAGIYIHIPFCKTRCAYCDFFSTTELSLLDALVDSLCKELQTCKSYIDNESIETIYFGGGTPSLLQSTHFQKIFDTITANFNTKFCNEITLEANPDDINSDYLKLLKTFPFNRISLGVQSFKEDELKLINRRHGSAETIEAYKLCQDFGFENISLDLIYGHPSQNIQSLNFSIDKLLEIRPKHISAYHLSYEKGTELNKKLQQKKITAVDEETSLLMFKILRARLIENGYDHYEISNFCLPDYASKHNSAYWSGKKYLGIGPSAHSYNGISRKWNVSSLSHYIKGINENLSVYEMEELTLFERYNDYILTSLRTSQGTNLTKITDEFGPKLASYCMKNADKHLINNNLFKRNNHLILSENGIFISDGIISDLLYAE